MPEHLRALIVILVLATLVFALAKAPACALAINPSDYARRRYLWYAITLAAFLTHSFWIYIFVAGTLLIAGIQKESNKLALFFFLLFTVPPVSALIPGGGIINHLFAIHHIRLLALLVLFPSFLFLLGRRDIERFGNSLPDKLILGYIVLQALLILSISTFTNTLRTGVFYGFIDIFLPYYVASRSLKSISECRDALMSFVVAALVLAPIAVFEFVRDWPLYGGLYDALGTPWNQAAYLLRDESFRAQGSAGHAIALGYIMAVAMGFFLFFGRTRTKPQLWYFGLACLIGGLIATLSRGPWVGAVVIFLVFIAFGPSPGKVFSRLTMMGLLILPILLFTPMGEKLVSYLPFVGTIEESTVVYRQRLLEISIQVILQRPFFGAYDYFYSPAMEELKQGSSGFIDIVNTYLAVALNSGLVGLSLFVGFFVVVVFGVLKAVKGIPDKNGELHSLGRTLLATLIGIMVIIFTVSSISFIPVIYWSIAGVAVAYARVLVRTRGEEVSPVVARPPRMPSNTGLNSQNPTVETKSL